MKDLGRDCTIFALETTNWPLYLICHMMDLGGRGGAGPRFQRTPHTQPDVSCNACSEAKGGWPAESFQVIGGLQTIQFGYLINM